ncbi:hypothetical protein E1B28_013324 [Marasmius oreades]|uniref:YDG domain-containing protein n=1 Tax=Marasmius oreades TaxID=181124 RepID=A0A9P7UPS5_9AGAR|nr:uncharacterized protein E1B28_013324 [Marasmius oreades]KAG7087349.1 hypothetical protein E1B28_013324 [Marasmius oreades]
MAERLRRQLAQNAELFGVALTQEKVPNRFDTRFGAPKNVKIGETFPSREAVREAGLHNSTFAGIAHHNGFAFAIVLSGRYEDDKDGGEEILYTGTGGQSDSFNNPGPQVQDQTFEHDANKALQNSCKHKVPIRVIRKDSHYSKYAPGLAKGNNQIYRYDGLYSVTEVMFVLEHRKDKNGLLDRGV